MPCKNHPEEVVGLVTCSRCGAEFCPSCIIELAGAFYCAACKREQVRDLESGVDGTQLDLASILRRFAALLVDWILAFGAAVAALAVALPGFFRPFGGPAPTPEATWFILLYAVVLGIPLLYEGIMLSWRGQTLGKMAFGVKVVTPEGNDISPGQAWLRTLMKVLLAMLYYVTFIAALFSRERKALHDTIARTRVVNSR
jgi:uncharacterized RDD family membrane protein YckC